MSDIPEDPPPAPPPPQAAWPGLAPVERRREPRVLAGESVVEFLGQRFPVANISASGLLVEPYSGNATVGVVIDATLDIKDAGHAFVVRVMLTVARVERFALAARFSGWGHGAREKLEAYFRSKYSSGLFNIKA